ncbi:MAG: hypothetical protein BGO78_07390 [Chloroflexi bacterium 44-23]|nr:MAG: hypothetical protein BGO78_07390 [Chloroflexi bacterium 44-23]
MASVGQIISQIPQYVQDSGFAIIAKCLKRLKVPVGHPETQWPQPVHFAWSIIGSQFVSVILTSCHHSFNFYE